MSFPNSFSHSTSSFIILTITVLAVFEFTFFGVFIYLHKSLPNAVDVKGPRERFNTYIENTHTHIYMYIYIYIYLLRDKCHIPSSLIPGLSIILPILPFKLDVSFSLSLLLSAPRYL